MNPEAFHFIVLYGKTGCGKSNVLTHIRAMGMQVLDLEEIAVHKGSAFGGLDGGIQPTQQEFEQMLQESLSGFDPQREIWVEYETAYLGKLQMPEWFYDNYRQSDLIILKMDRDLRIRKIIDEYAQYGSEKLLDAGAKLKKKMSHKKYRLLRKSIKNEDYVTAVSVLLSYYDRAYENGMRKGQFQIIGEATLEGEDPEKNAIQVLDIIQKLPKSRNPM